MATTIDRPSRLASTTPDPNQPRKSFDNAELGWHWAESLKKKQLVPVLARPDGTIIDGNRRWLAAKLVGLQQLDVIITDEPLKPGSVQRNPACYSVAPGRPDCLRAVCREPGLAGVESWSYGQRPGRQDRPRSVHPGAGPVLSLSKCIPFAPARQPLKASSGLRNGTRISKVPEAEQPAMLPGEAGGCQPRSTRRSRPQTPRWQGAKGFKVNRLLKIPLGPQGRSVTIAGSNLSLADAIKILQEHVATRKESTGDNLDGKTWVQVMKQKAKATV